MEDDRERYGEMERMQGERGRDLEGRTKRERRRHTVADGRRGRATEQTLGQLFADLIKHK